VNSVTRAFRVTVTLIVACVLGPLRADAQTPSSEWTEPITIASSPVASYHHPVAAADAQGCLHALWHANEHPNDPGGSTWDVDAVYYARWDQTGWTMPVDVLANTRDSGTGLGIISSLAVTPQGELVAASPQGLDVYLLRAPIDDAQTASAWSASLVDSGLNPILSLSSEGSLWCLSYWQDDRTSLLVRCSRDQGSNWETPTQVWSAPEGTVGGASRMLVGQDGVAHVVWTEYSRERNWSGVAIWYALVDPQTGNTTVRQVFRSSADEDPTLAWPALAQCPNGEIHMVWNNGVGSTIGRFYQWFSPDSQQWSQVTTIFPGLSGQTEPPGLVCDAENRLHLVTAADGGAFSSARLRYATRYERVWSDYATLWDGRYEGEHPQLLLIGGNQLHVLWDVFEALYADGNLYVAHSYRTIDAPSITLEPTASLPEAQARPSGTPPADVNEVAVQATPPTAVVLTASPEPSSAGMHRGRPLVYAVAAVIPLAIVVLWRYRPR